MFFILVALVLFALIYIFFTYREKQRHKMEMLRQNIARDLHDDMGSNLSQIKIISEMEAIKGSHEKFAEIAEKLTEVMATMSEIVWSINPLYDSFDDALLKIKEFAIEILEPRGINLHFEAASLPARIKLNTTQRRHLYLIFKEAINNIAKYAQADEVVFSVISQNQKTIISIKDNGMGFATLNPGSGNGLNNMKTRAMAIGADLYIHSGTSGTEVILVMS
ncbi:MAG: hypothetical protein IPN29_17695 [Saprospiraceae bacterium]|nr:hypothetical protein [Saprospiraceae bacterium]